MLRQNTKPAIITESFNNIGYRLLMIQAANLAHCRISPSPINVIEGSHQNKSIIHPEHIQSFLPPFYQANYAAPGVMPGEPW